MTMSALAVAGLQEPQQAGTGEEPLRAIQERHQ